MMFLSLGLFLRASVKVLLAPPGTVCCRLDEFHVSQRAKASHLLFKLLLCSLKSTEGMGLGCSSVIEYLPSMHHALSSISSTTEKRRQKGKEEGKKEGVSEQRKQKRAGSLLSPPSCPLLA